MNPNSLAARAALPSAPKRALSWKLFALAGVSAAFGLVGASNVSKLRMRSSLDAQFVSGNPALKKSSDGESVRWHTSQNKVYFDASLDAAGPRAREAVQLGFGTWLGSGANLPKLEFDSTTGARFGQTPNGKSEVMYGPIVLAGHENDLALTVTFSDPKSGAVVESDVIFNSTHHYGVLSAPMTGPMSNEACEQKYDLQSVATHEAGHFFGLGEDFDAKQATMYYTTGRCETNKRALQNSDETTMSALYLAGSAEDGAETAKGCGGARIGQGRTGGSVPTLALSGLLGFVLLRRGRARRRPAR